MASQRVQLNVRIPDLTLEKRSRMPYAEECERPFYIEPSVLLTPNFAPSIACSSNAINSLVRGSVVITLLCLAISTIYGPHILVFGLVVVTALYGPSLYATFLGGAGYGQKAQEGFIAELLTGTTQPAENYADQQVDVIGSAVTETKSTSRNPFMNILVDELKYNPRRPPAQDINDPLVKTQLDDFFRVQWSSDPTDVFGRAQSQREFYTVPSTSIPNDVDSYQNWLYRIPGKTCKEGGREACVTYNNSPLVSNWVGS